MIREKVLPKELLNAKLEEAREAGKTIVFTNGCFDVLHAGHVLLLDEASALGDLLVVGMNSDRSVKLIKGPSRPINQENLRTLVIAALSSVDFVCLFDEPTPIELIKLVKPDVLVKGDDWLDKGVVGRELVEKRGGKVVLLPLVKGLSTTSIIEKIRQINQKEKCSDES